MSIAKDIAPHLPYLRRFARALCGSQAGGDAYVVSTLEALVADPASFPAALGTRLGLYTVFMKLWSSISLNTSHVIDENLPPGQKSLNQLTPRSRQAFLLSTVEEFTRPQVAAIMGVDESEVGALITAAGKEISQQVATEVLIIEDEPLIALDLQAIVLDLGHQTTGIARTHRDAMRLANAKRPGLVLADIQLADGSSGLDAVNEILKSFDVPIIFITAYPERLLTGERPEPAFLITKPFQTDTVKATISQALFFDRVSSRSAA